MSTSVTPGARLVTIRSRSPSSRILLRSPIHSDAYSFTARAHDPLCTTFLPHIRSPKSPITVASNEKQIKKWRVESGITGLSLAIVLLSPNQSTLENEVSTDIRESSPSEVREQGPVGESGDAMATIGETGFGSLDLVAKTGECGIMLMSGPLVRGKGYAVEALDMTFAYGFDHLGLERINLGTHKDNLPMRSLMEKKFGVPAQWREEKNDWEFVATPEWWNARQSEAGENRLVLDVEESALGDSD
ncbi:hypothetical protein BDZ97DRAFT_1757470 [Flammula alnicola]|nr:hypothetical protein BDZ97DRAFT_1757470 [Flammula alnicola]